MRRTRKPLPRYQVHLSWYLNFITVSFITRERRVIRHSPSNIFLMILAREKPMLAMIYITVHLAVESHQWRVIAVESYLSWDVNLYMADRKLDWMSTWNDHSRTARSIGSPHAIHPRTDAWLVWYALACWRSVDWIIGYRCPPASFFPFGGDMWDSQIIIAHWRLLFDLQWFASSVYVKHGRVVAAHAFQVFRHGSCISKLDQRGFMVM